MEAVTNTTKNNLHIKKSEVVLGFFYILYKMKHILISGLLLLTFSFSCEKKSPNEAEPIIKDEFVILDYSVSELELSNKFELNPSKGGTLQNHLLEEASGICVSRSNPAILWSHNDSGHPNRIFPIGTNGENYGHYVLTGAGTRDYEDICIGPGEKSGVNYIYLGDIGDNHAQYSYIVIYQFEEPNTVGLDSAQVYYINAEDITRYEFTYPDGPRDAETLMIDPWTKDLYIISKRDYRSIVYRAKYPFDKTKRTELEKLAQLPFNWAVAGDISADGTKIVIKDKNRLYFWERNINESVVDALKRKPKLLPYVLEPQGESFGWSESGDEYFTLSEQSGIYPPDVYAYKRK